MHARNIKDLCIALEALSRFPSDSERREEVNTLLDKEVQLMQEEQHPLQTYAPTRPPPGVDDDIPF